MTRAASPRARISTIADMREPLGSMKPVAASALPGDVFSQTVSRRVWVSRAQPHARYLCLIPNWHGGNRKEGMGPTEHREPVSATRAAPLIGSVGPLITTINLQQEGQRNSYLLWPLRGSYYTHEEHTESRSIPARSRSGHPRHHWRGAAGRRLRVPRGRCRHRPGEGQCMVRYVSVSEYAAQLGISQPTLSGYKLPGPDAIIGKTRGWLQETLDEWNRNRPGQGHRPKKARKRMACPDERTDRRLRIRFPP